MDGHAVYSDPDERRTPHHHDQLAWISPRSRRARPSSSPTRLRPVGTTTSSPIKNASHDAFARTRRAATAHGECSVATRTARPRPAPALLVISPYSVDERPRPQLHHPSVDPPSSSGHCFTGPHRLRLDGASRFAHSLFASPIEQHARRAHSRLDRLAQADQEMVPAAGRQAVLERSRFVKKSSVPRWPREVFRGPRASLGRFGPLWWRLQAAEIRDSGALLGTTRGEVAGDRAGRPPAGPKRHLAFWVTTPRPCA